jgi:hypothetical protein
MVLRAPRSLMAASGARSSRGQCVDVELPAVVRGPEMSHPNAELSSQPTAAPFWVWVTTEAFSGRPSPTPFR